MIDPTVKNWVADYIAIRDSKNLIDSDINSLEYEEKLYNFLFETGFPFGHPINLHRRTGCEVYDWPIKERIEIIYLDSLISSYCFFYKIDNPTEEDITKAVEIIYNFLLELYPDYKKKKISIFSTKDNYLLLEKLLKKHIKFNPQWNNSFWKGFFNNYMLYSDVILFTDFLKSGDKKPDLKYPELHKDLQEIIASIIVYLSESLGIEESKIDEVVNSFLEINGYSKKKIKRIDKINLLSNKNILAAFNPENSYLLKRFVLDFYAIYTWALSDQSDDFTILGERAFGNSHISPADIESSFFSVESFVMQHWDQVNLLRSKQNFMVLRERVSSRIYNICQCLSSEIKSLFADEKVIVESAKISNIRPLSFSEKEKLRSAIINILYSLPVFRGVNFPISFLTISVLFKSIPQEFLSCQFDINNILNVRGSRVEES